MCGNTLSRIGAACAIALLLAVACARSNDQAAATAACGAESERILRLQGVQARRAAVVTAQHLDAKGLRAAVDSLALPYAPFDRVRLLEQVVHHLCEGGDDEILRREALYPRVGSGVPAMPMRVLWNGADAEPGVLRMADIRARWTVVHHLPPECLPCTESDDSIASLATLPEADVRVVSIVVSREPAAFEVPAAGTAAARLVLFADPAFRHASDLTSLPSVALVDSTGVVVDRCVGCTSHPALFGHVREMLGRWF